MLIFINKTLNVTYESLKTKEKSSWVTPKVGAVAYESFSLQSLSRSSNWVSQRWSQLDLLAYDSGHKDSLDCIALYFINEDGKLQPFLIYPSQVDIIFVTQGWAVSEWGQYTLQFMDLKKRMHDVQGLTLTPGIDKIQVHNLKRSRYWEQNVYSKVTNAF